MSVNPTAYQLECARIDETEGPRVFERDKAFLAERGWTYLRLSQEQEAERDAEFGRFCTEEAERSMAMKLAIPEDILTDKEVLLYRREGPAHGEAVLMELQREIAEHEEAARQRRLDYAESWLCGEGKTLADIDLNTVPLRAVFIGISAETLRELEERHLGRMAAMA
ncbi:glutathione S-transferase family protein [Tabrizicola oligotrophica]|uniref:Uncharacterized protein n=1 Tax=Tabrizicola oligotrophica TaxID=2710650 RepID=A0A6M0QW27_9RHOB|nr:hypothetical protein [Tabrizicola oligotrophica]NEY91686.1 hypothetical protein [Tabrizicola oligotrophica]